MNAVMTVDLTRDCAVIQIPAGQSVVLPKGTTVDITQDLGGSYTIHAQGGLFRVGNNDADALGLGKAASGTVTGETSPALGAAAGADGDVVTEQRIWDTLKTCYDSEIPVNIVDLGLVYEMELKPLPSGNSRVDVKMTLTAPGCGMGGVIAGDAQQKLLMLDGVEEAIVEIVWDPPWHQSRISADGRRLLGLE